MERAVISRWLEKLAGPGPSATDRQRAWSWALLLASHLLAVLYSRGYMQMDEHFQVLEYIQWKFGAIALSDMPWELSTRMRPWIHIYAFYPLEWLSRHGLELSPFVRTTLHRACVALLALYAIRRITRRHPEQLLLFATLFFYPLFDVRLSSEVIGAWLFMLGLMLDEELAPGAPAPARLRLVGIGFLFGLAVAIRLMVLALLGGLGLFIARKREWRRIRWYAAGFVLATGCAALCDRLGYGEFTFVPWNYVNQNVVLGNAVHFGSAPFYAYVPLLLEQSGYLPGAVLLVALFFHWWRRPLDKSTWMSLPFVVAHCCIAHKELRYLFPIAPLMPEMLLTLWRALAGFAPARLLARGYLGLNLLLVLPAVLHDGNAYVGLYAALFEHAPQQPAVLYYKNNTDPLRPWGLRPSYYLEWLPLSSRPLPHRRARWHGLVMLDALAEYRELRREDGCQLLASRYPPLLLDRWPSFLPEKHAPWLKLWSLWRCR